eukprot:5363388-Pleurochrysis_carterae.AAC.1
MRERGRRCARWWRDVSYTPAGASTSNAVDPRVARGAKGECTPRTVRWREGGVAGQLTPFLP